MQGVFSLVLLLWIAICVKADSPASNEERRTLATDVAACQEALEFLNETYYDCINGSAICTDEVLTAYLDLSDCMDALESDEATPLVAPPCSYFWSIFLTILATITAMCVIMSVFTCCMMMYEGTKMKSSDRSWASLAM